MRPFLTTLIVCFIQLSIMAQDVSRDIGINSDREAAFGGNNPSTLTKLLNNENSGQVGFFDNFEDYTAGQRVACQNPENWTTWSNLPCDAVQDPYISNNFAYSGNKSVVIIENNDLVKAYGPYTIGTIEISFRTYIPNGKTGYFNTLSNFSPPNYELAMQVTFKSDQSAQLDAAGNSIPFNYQQNSWLQNMVVVDLDNDQATFEFGNSAPLTMVHQWQWTLGANGGSSPLQLDANDFFGATANDEMYFDNYYVGDAYPPVIPVELTSFTAVGNNGVVELNWQTATEVNNHMFEIERKSANTEYRTIGYVEGAGTTTEPMNYSYVDKTVDLGSYTYRLKQIDYNGTYTYSPEVEVDVTAPLTFNLEQNYPNPFNPSTKINYSVPEAGNVKLAVYNIVGEEVAVLVNGYTEAGHFNVSFDASNLPSGVYLYKLQSDNSVQTKKMMLLK